MNSETVFMEQEYLAGTSSTAMGDPDRDDINLPSPEDQGYETMPSGGSSDDEEEDDSDLRETEPSVRVRDLIAGYSSRTNHTEEHLIRSNDYFRSAQTTREWDEDVTFDGPLDNSIFEAENCIPNELVEGICFKDKKQLQFAVQGWCITNNERESRRVPEPMRININEYQVFDATSRTFKVEVNENNDCKCTCGQPQAYHLPCAHVIAVLSQRRISHVTFVSPYYSLQNYMKTYQSEFHVIPDREEWMEHFSSDTYPTYCPPDINRKSGRPRTSRYRNSMDESISRSSRLCGVCKTIGHNRSTCPQNRVRRM